MWGNLLGLFGLLVLASWLVLLGLVLGVLLLQRLGMPPPAWLVGDDPTTQPRRVALGEAATVSHIERWLAEQRRTA